MKNNKKVLILFLLASCYMIGCSKGNIAQTNDDSTKNSNVNVSVANTVDKNMSVNKVNQNETQDIDTLKSWVGVYTFSEYAPPDENMDYNITVYKEDNTYYADISIDGFQTIIRYKAKIAGDDSNIDLVFDSYLPDNMYEPYAVGDVLLSFAKKDSVIYTYWGKIQPMLESNMKIGQIYFEYNKHN